MCELLDGLRLPLAILTGVVAEYWMAVLLSLAITIWRRDYPDYLR